MCARAWARVLVRVSKRVCLYMNARAQIHSREQIKILVSGDKCTTSKRANNDFTLLSLFPLLTIFLRESRFSKEESRPRVAQPAVGCTGVPEADRSGVWRLLRRYCGISRPSGATHDLPTGFCPASG